MTVSRVELRIEVTAEFLRRFNAKVDRTPGHGPNGDCHLWTGADRGCGYGAIKATVSGTRRIVDAHRVAWVIANDSPIPAGLLVRHRCDVRLCVNPSHLELGTSSQNRKDAIDAGHGRTLKRPFTLPPEILTAVITLFDAGVSQRQIAKHFEIPPTNLRRLLRNLGRLNRKGVA